MFSVFNDLYHPPIMHIDTILLYLAILFAIFTLVLGGKGRKDEELEEEEEGGGGHSRSGGFGRIGGSRSGGG